MFQEALTYDDVILEPKFSEIRSRKDLDISNNLGSIPLNIPIVSAPMDTVTGHEMATAMALAGGLGVIHRYNSINEQVTEFRSCGPVKACLLPKNIGVAIGATGDYMERAEALVEAGASVFCVDVAHGHHIFVKEALRNLRDKFGKNIHIMTGNVATPQAFKDLADWGADSIRVGIGGGSTCSTRLNTGHGIPNISSIMGCYQVFKGSGPTLIADGGIRKPGDMVKAFAAGADLVMCGSMLAGTKESPGEVIDSVDSLGRPQQVKRYRGMASREAQNNWRGKSSSPEGIATSIPYKGSVNHILDDICGNIKSGLSYSGATTIKELREKADFIKQSSASVTEGFTHILNKS